MRFLLTSAKLYLTGMALSIPVIPYISYKRNFNYLKETEYAIRDYIIHDNLMSAENVSKYLIKIDNIIIDKCKDLAFKDFSLFPIYPLYFYNFCQYSLDEFTTDMVLMGIFYHKIKLTPDIMDEIIIPLFTKYGIR